MKYRWFVGWFFVLRRICFYFLFRWGRIVTRCCYKVWNSSWFWIFLFIELRSFCFRWESFKCWRKRYFFERRFIWKYRNLIWICILFYGIIILSWYFSRMGWGNIFMWFVIWIYRYSFFIFIILLLVMFFVVFKECCFYGRRF